MQWSNALWLLAIQPVVKACVELHTTMQFNFYTADTMSMQVWYNGRLVCQGSGEVGQFARDTTTFSLRNSDGKGSGCEEGFGAEITNYGRSGTFYNYKMGTSSPLVVRQTRSQVVDCGTLTVGDTEKQERCEHYESCLVDNNGCGAPAICRLCEFEDTCDYQERIGNQRPGVPFKAMIIGDSITQGDEGDWTWRYRLWEWLKNQGVSGYHFTGPYTGTQPPAKVSPPTPPPVDGETVPDATRPTTGRYNLGVNGQFFSNYDNTHFSRWGYPMAFAKGSIAGQLKTYPADYVLIMLGFNDLGWFYNGPAGLLIDAKATIDAARSVNPNIRVLFANMVQRKALSNRPDLAPMIDDYNKQLANAIQGWSDKNSPVSLVNVNGEYSCQPDSCPSGYDGLHPNARGEFEIARAFSKVLVDSYGIGSKYLDVPSNPPARPALVPSNPRAMAQRYGVTFQWDPLFGAHSYQVRMVNKAWGSTTEFTSASTRYDYTWVVEGMQFDFQVRSWMGDGDVSAWSNVVSVTAKPSAPSGPKNITASSSPGGVSLSWSPPDGNWNIDRYGVYAYDSDVSGAISLLKGVKGTSYRYTGLTPGHKYIIAIETWDKSVGGPGLPANGPDTVAGAGSRRFRRQSIVAADNSTLSDDGGDDDDLSDQSIDNLKLLFGGVVTAGDLTLQVDPGANDTVILDGPVV